MKKKIILMGLVCLVSSLCFAESKFYRTRDGYSGYAEMHYQGTTSEWSIEKINQNLFIISNAFGYFPVKRNKLSNA